MSRSEGLQGLPHADPPLVWEKAEACRKGVSTGTGRGCHPQCQALPGYVASLLPGPSTLLGQALEAFSVSRDPGPLPHTPPHWEGVCKEKTLKAFGWRPLFPDHSEPTNLHFILSWTFHRDWDKKVGGPVWLQSCLLLGSPAIPSPSRLSHKSAPVIIFSRISLAPTFGALKPYSSFQIQPSGDIPDWAGRPHSADSLWAPASLLSQSTDCSLIKLWPVSLPQTGRPGHSISSPGLGGSRH